MGSYGNVTFYKYPSGNTGFLNDTDGEDSKTIVLNNNMDGGEDGSNFTIVYDGDDSAATEASATTETPVTVSFIATEAPLSAAKRLMKSTMLIFLVMTISGATIFLLA